MRVRALFLAVCSALLMAACADDSPVPTDPSRTVAVTHESFSGTLPLLGARFYSFTVPHVGNADVTLLSLRESGSASSATVAIGIGVPRATDCTISNTVNTAVSPSPVLAVNLDPGVYCVRIFDTGTLTAPVDFSINITRPL